MSTVSLLESLVEELHEKGQPSQLADVLRIFASDGKPVKSWNMSQLMLFMQMKKLQRKARRPSSF